MRHGIITPLLLLAAVACTSHTEGKRYIISFDSPVPSIEWPPKEVSLKEVPKYRQGSGWERFSLPIGNGSIGANVFGGIAEECLTFNEKTLWNGGPGTPGGAEYYWNVNKESAPVLTDIREAYASGDMAAAARLTEKNFNGLAHYSASDENPHRFGNFTTMGKFIISTGLEETATGNYCRYLSIDSAIVKVQFVAGGQHYSREYFISYPDNVMVVRFSSDGPQQLRFSYEPCPDSHGEAVQDGSCGLLYRGHLNSNDMAFAVRVQALAGNVSYGDGTLDAEGDEIVFLVSADTDYKLNVDPDFRDPEAYVGVDPEATTSEWMKEAVSKGYPILMERHYQDYSALFDRVKLHLGGRRGKPAYNGNKGITSSERIAEYRRGAEDRYLEELYFQYGRYLLIASSRPGNMPANLQGIWHNLPDGPWNVDYHNNINIQMNYWPANVTNLAECGKPMLDYIESQVKSGERVARSYFGAEGWTSSISANIFGFASPLADEDMSWNFSPMAGPWLATFIWDYYDYTRDIDFLRDKGYRILRGSADFVTDYLWKQEDGIYTAAPSTSPEHGPVDKGATYAHAVARETLMDAISAAVVLGADEDRREQWQEVLDNIVPYKIGRYGQLMEWSIDIDDPEDHHRHVNHLFGLHPGHSLSPVTTPELAEAAKVVLLHRGDSATGWSMGWKLNQWARLHDGNHAYTLYGNLLREGTLDNLWDTHPPFQIDGNFGGTAGVAEMLLQSHMGFIQLLPALPDAWKEGSVSGLCARGNFTVDISWAEGKLENAWIYSGSGGTCKLRYGSAELAFDTVKGETYRLSLQDFGL